MKLVGEHPNEVTVRGCCRFIGFTTTVYPLRMKTVHLSTAITSLRVLLGL